jgi:hypothetical protein
MDSPEISLTTSTTTILQPISTQPKNIFRMVNTISKQPNLSPSPSPRRNRSRSSNRYDGDDDDDGTQTVFYCHSNPVVLHTLTVSYKRPGTIESSATVPCTESLATGT